MLKLHMRLKGGDDGSIFHGKGRTDLFVIKWQREMDATNQDLRFLSADNGVKTLNYTWEVPLIHIILSPTFVTHIASIGMPRIAVT